MPVEPLHPSQARPQPPSQAGERSEHPEHTALLVNAKRAAAMLGIGERKLWSLTACRAVPSYRIGSAVRYAPDELRAWVRAGCPTEPDAGEAIRKAVAR